MFLRTNPKFWQKLLKIDKSKFLEIEEVSYGEDRMEIFKGRILNLLIKFFRERVTEKDFTHLGDKYFRKEFIKILRKYSQPLTVNLFEFNLFSVEILKKLQIESLRRGDLTKEGKYYNIRRYIQEIIDNEEIIKAIIYDFEKNNKKIEDVCEDYRISTNHIRLLYDIFYFKKDLRE